MERDERRLLAGRPITRAQMSKSLALVGFLEAAAIALIIVAAFVVLS